MKHLFDEGDLDYNKTDQQLFIPSPNCSTSILDVTKLPKTLPYSYEMFVGRP